MAKNLSERIAARAAGEKSTRSAQNRAVFLALRGEVKQALDDGWPIKSIWETLHEEGKVAFSYQAFRGYTNRLILSPIPADRTPDQKLETRTAKTNKIPEPKTTKEPFVGGFTFNPIPKKEDLI